MSKGRANGYLQAVEDCLEQVLAEEIRTAPTARLKTLWGKAAEATSGGKRTRPQLVELAHSAWNGTHFQAAVEIGAAFELLHTALLMHDDVIDHDFMRRGRPTLSAWYRDTALHRGADAVTASRIGNSAGILAGDLLLTLATRMVQRTCHDLACGPAVVCVFHNAISCSVAGELSDLLSPVEAEYPRLTEVLEMHRQKTAAYSFESPLQAGALLAGATTDHVAKLAEIGSAVGITYQITDDIMGTFGAPAVTGKPNDSDLAEKKHTVLIALAEDTPETARAVHRWRAGELDDADFRAVLESFDVIGRAGELARDHSHRALQILETLPLEDTAAVKLESFINTTLSRTF